MTSGQATASSRISGALEATGAFFRFTALRPTSWLFPLLSIGVLVLGLAGFVGFIVWTTFFVFDYSGALTLGMLGAFVLSCFGAIVIRCLWVFLDLTLTAAYAFLIHERLEGRHVGTGRALQHALAHGRVIFRFALVPFAMSRKFIAIPLVVIEREHHVSAAFDRASKLLPRIPGRPSIGYNTLPSLPWIPMVPLALLGMLLVGISVGSASQLEGFEAGALTGSLNATAGIALLLASFVAFLVLQPISWGAMTMYRVTLYRVAVSGDRHSIPVGTHEPPQTGASVGWKGPNMHPESLR